MRILIISDLTGGLGGAYTYIYQIQTYISKGFEMVFTSNSSQSISVIIYIPNFLVLSPYTWISEENCKVSVSEGKSFRSNWIAVTQWPSNPLPISPTVLSTSKSKLIEDILLNWINEQKKKQLIMGYKEMSNENLNISKGFEENIDPKIIGHWKNLEILYYKDNTKKSANCSITLKQLLESIKRESN